MPPLSPRGFSRTKLTASPPPVNEALVNSALRRLNIKPPPKVHMVTIYKITDPHRTHYIARTGKKSVPVRKNQVFTDIIEKLFL